MKLLCQLFVTFTMSIFSMLAHAEKIEVADTPAGMTITTIIEPEATSLGRVVNVWISAVYKGVPYFYNGSAWDAYKGGPYPVAMSGKTLTKATKLVLVKEISFTSFPGADLYVGYGRNENEMKTSEGKLRKIITVGRKLKWGDLPAR